MPRPTPTPQQIEIHRWVRAHPRVTIEIAKLCGVSRVMVSRVLHKHCQSYEGKVEIELTRRGAPGWTKRT